jgi:adenylate kinase family enzyme
MSINLPSRYEDLDTAFRGRLKPNQSLLQIVKAAFTAMDISGGIRFLPAFGESGSGKTSAALEIGSHLPELYVEQLDRKAVEVGDNLRPALDDMLKRAGDRKLVIVIDQYEEVAAQRTDIPSNFVETLALLDRDRSRNDRVLFIWLTTSREFQQNLANATSRNSRILLDGQFAIESLSKADWPEIIKETFQFHNQERDLADYEILDADLETLSANSGTLGAAIEATGTNLASHANTLQDLSDYTVIMLWPVSDGLRISRVTQFTDARQGYKLDWNSWYLSYPPFIGQVLA